jgi:hypothetical protein
MPILIKQEITNDDMIYEVPRFSSVQSGLY